MIEASLALRAVGQGTFEGYSCADCMEFLTSFEDEEDEASRLTLRFIEWHE
jgi:hypothetical protein